MTRLKRPYAWLCAVATAFVSVPGAAQPVGDGGPGTSVPPATGEEPGASTDDAAESPPDDGFQARYVLDTGRVPDPLPNPNGAVFALRGEYQLRFRAATDLRLEPPVHDASQAALGQNKYLLHWSRVRPMFFYEDVLAIIGEIDFPRGLITGDTTVGVDAARDDYAETRWYDVRPRKLYLQFLTSIGLVRVGHQTSHWGMGLVANDGDHQALFGDYRRGTIVERALFATRPLGRGHPFAIAVGADVVYEDRNAVLLDGDRAFQGFAALRWDDDFDLGVYGVVRHQERDGQSVDAFTPYSESLTVGVVDVAGGFEAAIPGFDAYAFGEWEAAFIGGRTDLVRNVNQTFSGQEEEIRAFGGAMRLGATIMTEDDSGRYGRFVWAVEWGYASGDADPYDGVSKRFVFDENHNVGLVLFDQVLGYKTARSATIAQDPRLVNRPAPGLDLLPSNGSVFGAQYLYPTLVLRPQSWLDVKAGAVFAQSTADFVDPFQAGAKGNYANYEGGDPRAHDLGVEVDLGADARWHLSRHFVVNGGVEGGIFFPGGAFDGPAGRLPLQGLLNTKLGLHY